MPRILKAALIGIAALLVLLVAGAAILAATFNPNDYKPQIIALVKEKKQRTLHIPGDIKLSFFPKIGAELGQVSLSEPNSDALFASVERARLSLALLPLLSRELIVDRVQVEGLVARLRRDKDGSTNVDDLLSTEESRPNERNEPFRFDIDGVDIRNASLSWEDSQAQRKLEISGLDLKTGKLANAVPGKADIKARIVGSNPRVDASLDAKTGFLFDLEKQRYAVDKLDGQLKGALLDFTDLVLNVSGDADLQPAARRFEFQGFKLAVTGRQSGQPVELKLNAPELSVSDNKVSGGKLTGEAALAPSGRQLRVNFSLPSFEGSPQAFRLPSVLMEASIKDAATDARARLEGSLQGDLDKMLFSSPKLTLTLSGKQSGNAIDGSLSTGLNANLGAGRIELPAMAANLTLPHAGGGSLKLVTKGSAHADLEKKHASATLQGQLDESNFDAKLALTSFSPAAYGFDITIDKLDADRYRAKPGASTPAGKAEPEKPMDLSALRDLRANGSLKVGSLKAQNIRLTNVRLDMKAANGKVDVNPLNANLYGGSASGSASVVAADKPRFALRQTLSNVNIAPLLKDAIGKEPVEGRGNVSLDVTTEGALVAQLKKSLAGTARLELRDGAVKGFNIAGMIRNAKAKIGQLQGNAAPQTGTGSSAEKTDFSELTGSFSISRGVAHNQDLRAKSPLLRVDGAGDVDIGNDRLDYLVKATVVTTLQGQGGPELQALKGLTVPVRLSGPFTSIGYKVDFSGLAGDLVRKQLDGRKDEIKGRVEQELGKQLKGLFGR